MPHIVAQGHTPPNYRAERAQAENTSDTIDEYLNTLGEPSRDELYADTPPLNTTIAKGKGFTRNGIIAIIKRV